MVRLVTPIVTPLLCCGKGAYLSASPDLPPKSSATLHSLTILRNRLIGELSTFCMRDFYCYDIPRAKDFLRTSTCALYDLLMKEYGYRAWQREDEVANEAMNIAIACWNHFNSHLRGDTWIDTLRNTVLQHVGRSLRSQHQQTLEAAANTPSPLLLLAQTQATASKQAGPPPLVPAVASFGEELRRLLEEARIRPEDIAEEIGIEARNVYRHLAGQTAPTITNVGKYERALSKHLKRPVKLPTPAKRHGVS